MNEVVGFLYYYGIIFLAEDEYEYIKDNQQAGIFCRF